jgi:hypothetical protein
MEIAIILQAKLCLPTSTYLYFWLHVVNGRGLFIFSSRMLFIHIYTTHLPAPRKTRQRPVLSITMRLVSRGGM